MSQLRRGFPARLREFEQVRALIDEFGLMVKLDSEDRHKLTLIVEELFTNTVIHGFGGDSDSVVQVTLEQTDSGVRLIYEDSAPRHDSIADGLRTDIEATVRQRHVGGIGVAMALGLTKDPKYTFEDGHNRVVMTYLPNSS